jgi:phosphonate transport system substrate-binding protein
MPVQFTVSPDFNSNQLSPWFIFNGRLAKFLEEPVHLELFDQFQSLRRAVDEDRIDLIFANAFDAAHLVRAKGFLPVAHGQGRSDEALVAVAQSSPVQKVDDFAPGLRLASTDAPDVEMIGRILLEPANLDRQNTALSYCDNYVTVAKALLNQEADAGFFLKRSYEELSALIRRQLRPVITSHIYVVQHALLISPRLAAKQESLLRQLVEMSGHPADTELLKELGLDHGWTPMSQEDAEFMIDMMDTLLP